MLTRLFADNYRCLVNCELRPESVNLLLGPNGGGKSTLFSCLRRVRDFVLGDTTSSTAFPTDSLTRWETRNIQSFELECDIGTGGVYRYELQLVHDRGRARNQIAKETLLFDTTPLYRSDGKTAQLFRDDGSQGPELLCDWVRSGIGILNPRPDNTKLMSFRNALRKIWVIRIAPAQMSARSESEDEIPALDFSNFTSWLRFQQGANEASYYGFRTQLGDEVIEGFRGFRQTSAGDLAKILEVEFELSPESEFGTGTGVDSFHLRFDELSDGQRVLLALYALLHLAPRSAVLCLDEPENFLALPEIQPWLQQIVSKADDGRLRLFLISHHPGLIDFLAASSGVWCERANGAQTRLKRIGDLPDSGLPISELVARGWLHE